MYYNVIADIRKQNKDRTNLTIEIDNKIKEIYKPVDHNKYKPVFDFIISQFPDYKEKIEKAEVFLVTKEVLDKFNIPDGGGGFFNIVTGTIVIVEEIDKEDFYWEFTKNPNNIETTLVHELTHYISNLISPSRFYTDDEEFANEYTVRYCIDVLEKDKEYIVDNVIPFFGAAHVKDIIDNAICKKYGSLSNFRTITSLLKEEQYKDIMKNIYKETEEDGKIKAREWNLNFINKIYKLNKNSRQEKKENDFCLEF